MLAMLIVDVLDPPFPVDDKTRPGHNGRCSLMADVEQDHLFGYALSHAEVFSGKVALALFQWLVDLVGEVE